MNSFQSFEVCIVCLKNQITALDITSNNELNQTEKRKRSLVRRVTEGNLSLFVDLAKGKVGKGNASSDLIAVGKSVCNECFNEIKRENQKNIRKRRKANQ